jgi:hypothetical protein
MKVGKYSDHFPDDTFVSLAVETYGCLDLVFDGFLGTCARRAAELRAGDLGSVPLASRLICYYWSRVSISLQRTGYPSWVHHRAARAVQSSTGGQELAHCRFRIVGLVRSADLYIVTYRVGDS